MQYVFTMTSRMVTIAVASAVLLSVLLFLLGVEIGARMSHPAPAATVAPVAVVPDAASQSAIPASASDSASSTN
jgi:hypothetical protein